MVLRRRWLPCLAVLTLGLPYSAPHAGGASDLATLVRDNAAFACRLYGELAAGEPNLVFSPYGVSVVMAMAYAGARGDTEAEIAAALRFSLGQARLHPAWADLATSLTGSSPGGGLGLVAENSLWQQKDYPLLEDYFSQLTGHYGVSINVVDYQRASASDRPRINAWAGERTQGRIEELIAPGVLTPLARLTFANVVHFEDRWMSEFRPQDTESAPFHISPDRVVQAPMMTRALACGYASHPALDVIALPYAAGGLAMIVLLPKGEDGLRRLERELTGAALDRWLDSLIEQEVIVSLPRFRTRSALRMEDALRSLGVVAAGVGAEADFSGIDGQARWLCMSALLQQTVVTVNEAGTEAAAATAGVLALLEDSAPPSPAVQADHPFLFLIRETSSGGILFMGKLSDPTPSGE